LVDEVYREVVPREDIVVSGTVSVDSIPTPVDSVVTSSFALGAASGAISGVSVVHKFGANASVATGSTEDVVASGAITWATTATTMRVKAGNVADIDSSGAGARTITVQGLDSNWAPATEVLACNGSSAGTAGTTQFIRVFRAYVETAGTYTGNNTGDVVIEDSGGAADYITILAGVGQSETTQYTVPAGSTAYLTRLSAYVDAVKAVDMSMWQRRNADTTSAPVSAKRLIQKFPQLIGQETQKLDAYLSFPGKTDLWWSATASAGGSAPAVEADYDLIIVED